MTWYAFSSFCCVWYCIIIVAGSSWGTICQQLMFLMCVWLEILITEDWDTNVCSQEQTICIWAMKKARRKDGLKWRTFVCRVGILNFDSISDVDFIQSDQNQFFHLLLIFLLSLHGNLFLQIKLSVLFAVTYLGSYANTNFGFPEGV